VPKQSRLWGVLEIASSLTLLAMTSLKMGDDLTLSDVMTTGRRIINQLRVFNFRHGLDPSLEVPSTRYGSTPTDGPAEGKSIQPHFEWMKRFYFDSLGWDPATGKPLPHTLESLGLEKLIGDLDF